MLKLTALIAAALLLFLILPKHATAQNKDVTKEKTEWRSPIHLLPEYKIESFSGFEGNLSGKFWKGGGPSVEFDTGGYTANKADSVKNTQVRWRIEQDEKDATTITGLSSAWNYGNSTATTVGPPQYPGPAHAPLLLVDKISQQAKILFFGACALSPQFAQPNEVPAFLQMWDIRDARYGTAGLH